MAQHSRHFTRTLALRFVNEFVDYLAASEANTPLQLGLYFMNDANVSGPVSHFGVNLLTKAVLWAF